jgi:hypothetical protein
MEVTRDFVIRDILKITTNGFTKQGVRFKPPTPQSISFGGFFIFIDKLLSLVTIVMGNGGHL